MLQKNGLKLSYGLKSTLQHIESFQRADVLLMLYRILLEIPVSTSFSVLAESHTLSMRISQFDAA